MKKAIILIATAITLFLVASITLSGCAVDQQSAVQSAVESALESVAAETTAVAAETAAAETTAAVETGAYDYYELLRASAIKNEAYPDAPAAGQTLAFTNIMGGITFCEAVWKNVQDQWVLAGGDPASLYYADNQYDATIGLKNADIMLAKNPNVLINFQFDSKVNSIISIKFGQANIPIIAVDVPTPGAPFMGVNNFKVAYLAGEEAIKRVEDMGGIDKIDNIILMQMPAAGEVLMLRSEGFYQAFVDKYGAEVIDPKTVRADGGAGEAEQANKSMTDVLATIPNAKNCVLTSINAQTMSGIISAIQTAGRWDPEKWIVITQGADETANQQIVDGLVKASIAYFPERYGEYLVPASVALMKGEVVPPFMYVENVVISMDNMKDYYPEMLTK
ncbi:MAG: substrate-binding domain-containing protein [Actinobacteria bacterium]|nr:substrate-binding domain-containing protein [Actinomycetota bacterium]MCG2789415.1 substrate-binding domain-containing protein [Actinomycetes bacterium]